MTEAYQAVLITKLLCLQRIKIIHYKTQETLGIKSNRNIKHLKAVVFNSNQRQTQDHKQLISLAELDKVLIHVLATEFKTLIWLNKLAGHKTYSLVDKH